MLAVAAVLAIDLVWMFYGGMSDKEGRIKVALAQRTSIAQAILSAIENDRVRLGVERARVLARALKCHPAVLVFPGWEDHPQTSA